MPRYYFDTTNGERDRDSTGTELADDEQAVREAIRYVGGLIGDQPSLLDARSELLITARSDAKVVAQVRVEVVRPV